MLLIVFGLTQLLVVSFHQLHVVNIAHMVKAIQEQQKMIEALKKQNELLLKRMEAVEKEKK